MIIYTVTCYKHNVINNYYYYYCMEFIKIKLFLFLIIISISNYDIWCGHYDTTITQLWLLHCYVTLVYVHVSNMSHKLIEWMCPFDTSGIM